MKFSCLQENLNQGLGIVGHLKSNNATLPILNNILIEAKKSGLVLSATDLEIGVKTHIRCKVEKPGEFTIPTQIFGGFVNLLPNQLISAELVSEQLALVCDSYHTKIKGLDAGDFPVIPEMQTEFKYTLNIEDFKKALKQTLFSINSAEMRAEISGLYFNFNQRRAGELVLAATDSYRLSETSVKLVGDEKSSSKEAKEVIVPLKALQLLNAILSTSGKDELEIRLDSSQITFAFSETEIISKTIAGNYPDYRQIIPKEFKTEAICNAEELIRVVKSTSLFARAGVNDINLKFSAADNKIIITSVNDKIGESIVDLKADIKGEDNEIVFNYRYLLDGLQSLDGGEVSLNIVNGTTPGMLKNINSKNYLYIVMPITNW